MSSSSNGGEKVVGNRGRDGRLPYMEGQGAAKARGNEPLLRNRGKECKGDMGE